jgi:hypothetical protein
MREAVERVAYHAALLAGEGLQARALAHYVAAAAFAGEGRSCLDGGASLQLFLDAPGPPSFRFAVRLDQADLLVSSEVAPGLVEDDDARALLEACRSLAGPFEPGTFGAWFMRDERGVALAVDARGSSSSTLAARLQPVLPAQGQARLTRYLSILDGATPWAIAVTASGGRVRAVDLRWSLARGVHPARMARALVSEPAWQAASDLLGGVLGEPPGERTRPWQIATRLDEEGPLSIATSAWSRRIDVEAKRERLVTAFEGLGGPWRQVDGTWRLLRQSAPDDRRWTIGRGLEARVGGDVTRLRAVLVPFPPQLGGGAIAGRISSSSELTTAAAAVGTPKRS